MKRVVIGEGPNIGVGADAVVSRSFEAGAVIAGVLAKRIVSRF